MRLMFGCLYFDIILERMRGKIFLFILFFSLAFISRAEGEIALNITQSLSVTLDPSTPKIYKIVVPQDVTQDEDFNVHAQPTIADPFQIPYLTISADQGYNLQCFMAHAEFAGTCVVPAAELTKGREFSLQVKCVTKCKLNLKTYLGHFVNLEVGKELRLTAYAQEGLSIVAQIQVPSDLNYTALAVMALITNLEQNVHQADEGLELLVNYGNKDVEIPNEGKFAVQGQVLFSGGKGLFLLKENVPPGSFIKAFVQLKQGLSIAFTVISVRGSSFDIDLGRSYFDFSEKEQNKTYTLNTSTAANDIINKTIEIVFDIYSGNPTIEISFTQDFKKIVSLSKKASAMSYSLSPSVRKQNGFKDCIYIRVKSTIASEFYFYSQLNRDDVSYIQPYLTYFDEIEHDHVENYLFMERYTYQQDENSTMRNYTFQIETIQGKGSFFFKRCESMERTSIDILNVEGCLYHKLEELRDDKFYVDQIQNKHVQTGNKLSIHMNYDIMACSKIGQSEGKTNLECVFHIIALGESEEQFQFSLTVERKYHVNYLREHKVIKDYITRNSYLFYAFSLPNIEGVNSISIFQNTLSGDSSLIISTKEHLPTLESNQKDVTIESGEKNIVVLKGAQIAKNIYIAVYGYQFTEINLGVVVHRNTDTEDQAINELQLDPGSIMTYTLNATEPKVYFKLNPRNSTAVTINFNELVGHIYFIVTDIQGKNVSCEKNSSSPLSCSLKTRAYNDYRVIVWGEEKKDNKFTISFKNNSQSCTAGVLNYPLFVALAPDTKQCYSFPINRELIIKFVSAFTHTQLLNKEIGVALIINGVNFKAIEDSHYDITLEDMNNVCPMGLKRPGFVKTCEIAIEFSSQSNRTSYFNFIMEEDDAEVALFDGIVEKIIDLNLYTGAGKSFYYHFFSKDSVKLFFTTQTLKSNFFLAATIVSKDTFIKRYNDSQQIYPAYVDPANRLKKDDMRDNHYTTTLGRTGTSIITIEKEYLKKYCPEDNDCYFLISVYPDFPDESDQNAHLERSSYEIEISQEESYLALGDSKIGYIEGGQIFTYLIDPEDALISIRNMNSEGRASAVCVVISSAYRNGTVLNGNEIGGNMILKKSDNIERIFIRGDIKKCTYQISYTSLKTPIKNVRLSNPYDLKISKGETQGFLYYHQNSASFKIVQMISAGKANIYIMPFKESVKTLTEVLAIDYKTYPIIDTIDGDYVVSSRDQNFCSNCFYYIHVVTESKFVGEIVFVRMYDPIPLTVNHIFKEWLLPRTELAAENYVFYSLTNFELTFNMLSGKIRVSIHDPNGKQIVQEDVTAKKTYLIKAIDYDEHQKVEFYSLRTQFKIRAQALIESEYYLKIDRLHATERIFEGLPSSFEVPDIMPISVEFINSQEMSKPLTLMVDVKEKKGENATLTFAFTGQLDNGELVDGTKLFIQSTQADNTYVINLKNIKGTYFIAISTNIAVNVTMLLFKNELTHITPSSNHFFNTEGIFQLFTDDQNVMIEIFNCQGDISLIASKDYSDVADPKPGMNSPIELKRPNYGGHYVFGVENMFGSYFLKVNNKKKGGNLEYLINYYYYDQVNPYESLDAANYVVNYDISEAGLKLDVSPPVITDATGSIIIKSVNYWAYLSKGKESLNRYSRCAIEGDTIEYFSKDKPSITIQNDDIKPLALQNSTESIFVNVQASIQVQIVNNVSKQATHYPKVLTILYNTIQIPTASWVAVAVAQPYTYWFTNSGFIFVGWMLLPFMLAAIMIFYILKYCLRRLMANQNNMVEEVEIVASSQTVPTAHKLQDGIDTGAPMVKEHI